MPKKLNLLGQTYGRLTVIAEAPNHGKRTAWLCRCSCGNEVEVITDSLRDGKIQSCGCLRKEMLVERNKRGTISLVGQRFGQLTVIEQAPSRRGHSCWICKCDCGNLKEVCSVDLKRGDTLSCGCLNSSFGEKTINQILIDHKATFQREYSFPDLVSENQVPLRFDFALFDTTGNLARLIEYDGEQHFKYKTDGFWADTLKKRQARDKLKTDYCLSHNIPLVRIPYWEKNNITLELLLSSKYLIKE